MENIYQLLTRLEQQIKLLRQKADEMSAIIGVIQDSAQPPVAPKVESLSLREKQVFDLLKRGLTPKQIAGELKISAKTVYIHREKIRQKLGFPSFEQLLKTLPPTE